MIQKSTRRWICGGQGNVVPQSSSCSSTTGGLAWDAGAFNNNSPSAAHATAWAALIHRKFIDIYDTGDSIAST